MPERRVLFLVSDFAPLTSVGRIRTQKMCKFLPEFGWRTSVLTVDPPPGTLTDPELLGEVPAETSVYRVPCQQPIEVPFRWASEVVHRLRGRNRPTEAAVEQTIGPEATPANPQGQPGPLRRLAGCVDRIKHGLTRRLMIPDEGVTGIRAMVRAAVEIVYQESIDVLVSSVPGFSPWLAAVAAGRRTGVPVVVDYRDLWHRDVLRTWVGPLRTRFELMLERWALLRTHAVVTVSEGKTRLVRGLDPEATNKPYATIYNGFDEDDLVDLEPSRPRRDRGRLLLLYSGRLYKHRRIDPLFESVGRLVNNGQVRRDQLRVRVLGSIEADQNTRLDQIVRRHGLEDVVELNGYVTRREALAQQLGADVLVLIVDPGETSAGVLPGKISEYMGLGRFVLAVCPPGEAQAMLESYDHAAWVSADEPDKLDAALDGLIRRWRCDRRSVTRRVSNATVPTRRQNAADLAIVLDRVAGVPSVASQGDGAGRGVPQVCQC